MSARLPLDPEAVRALFPAFSEPSLEGWGFFENAGGSYTSRHVLDLLETYYRRTKVQPYAPYPASTEAGEAMDRAHERLAAALNLPVDWIHIGPSTSANTYTLAHAFNGQLREGDAIIVTNQDHEANTGAFRRLANRGIEVREWTADPQTGHLDLERLEKLLDGRVKLVAFPHASNIVAEINPVAEICGMARKAGAWTCVDGVSYAPHGLPDVAALGADIYLFSAYKTYGPHQGVMAVRPELADLLPNQAHFFNDSAKRKRLVPAGPDHAQVAACAGIADYLEELAGLAPDKDAGPFRTAHDAMREQETLLLAPLLDDLKRRNNIRLLGPSDPAKRAPTVAIAGSRPGADYARALAEHRIMASGGHFYAYRLVKAMGVDPEHGVLRLSFTHYTSPGEIELLVQALDAVLS